MENIETLLAAVAQTQGFDDDDEPAVHTAAAPPPPSLEKSNSSPEIPVSQLVEVPLEVSRDLPMCSTANRPLETGVPAMDPVIGAAEKKKRGRPPKGQLPAKSPPQKRSKQEDEEEDVCFICFDGGSLVLCDRRGCPKAYHPACIKRDEAFFKSKAKWNCGWHICSVCRKASHYVCYTCTYSLCKGCTKDADYLCVRGNKGFCSTCMKIIMLIENQGHVHNDSAVKVDFDDVTSWEYLFKMYWVPLKEKLSLTMSDLTKARKPWKGVSPVVCKPEFTNVHNYVHDGKVSVTSRSSEHLEISKLEEAQKETLMPTVSSTGHHIEKPNSDKETKIGNPNEPIIEDSCGKDIMKATHNPVIKSDEDNLSIVKDPDNSAGFVDTVASGMEVDGNNFLMQVKNTKQEIFGESEERKSQNNSSNYAAIDVHNINLIYLPRNMMENLVEDKENFHDKVVGSIVRIRISSDDHKPDVYRLVKVVGTCKVAKPYKIGDRTADIMLEVLNLDMKEVISVDAISNQDFTEEECRQLHQGIKCGLMKQFTLDEIRKKAMTLQPVRLKHLLKSPEEYQHRILQVPEIHADLDISPDYESQDAISGDNSIIKDGSRSEVNVTNSAIGDITAQRAELETSTNANIIETQKLWHYRDHNGKIQGPFSMMHLRDSSTIGLFPHDMRIWTNHEQYDSLLLTDALSGIFHDHSSELEKHNKTMIKNDGESKQNETAYCDNASVSSMRANESPSWPQCWDLLKDNNSSADEADELDNGPQNIENNQNRPTQNEITSGHKSQENEEKTRPMPINLSLNDIEVSSNVPLQNSGILELLSPTPANEIKPPVLPNDILPEVGNEWCGGYSSTPAKPCAADAWDSDLKTHEVTSWLAMMNEPIEFDALGEESVSDLLAEVDAMESQGVFPSPTSAMKFAKEMQDCCRDDCFSSIEEFTAGKSCSSSTAANEMCRPPVMAAAAASVMDGLDSFNNSSSVGSAVENNSSCMYTGETVGPCWGTVQGNINLVTVQGNVNLVLGGPAAAQGMTNLGWGNPNLNPNLNQSHVNVNHLPWEGPQKYGGERFPSPRDQWGGYQGGGGGEQVFGRGPRPPWGRPPFGGGGGYSRPPPKGQRVCKFYESGRCKKGAFCDYLHP